jgi:DNA-binding NtrC family response regulator
VNALEIADREDIASLTQAVFDPLPRILVVEDDEDVCDGLRWSLAPAYEVATQSTALKALAWCTFHRLDLLIIDYQLPDLDGIALLQMLRKAARVRVPALMISAYEDRAPDALRSGFEDFFEKPIREWTLAVAVGRALGLG